MLRCWPAVRVILPALFVVAAAPAPAPAAEGGGAAAELFAPRLDLTIWTLVVFGLLVLVLRKYAWGPILDGLKARELRLRGALDEAHQARDDAQKLRDDLQAEMDKVHDKMRALLDEARRDGQAVKDKMVAEARAEIQAEKDRARQEIQTDSSRARQELWSQAAQLATLVSAKVIGRSLTADDHRGLVDEAVAELQSAAPGRTTG
jgi:F-type H+-transporting ATPase subunit b